MKSKLFSKHFLGLILVIASALALSQAPMIGIPIIGGVILQGILGGFSGKVGPVVGAFWKGIAYMRGYVVPANPNTAGQQLVRSTWSVLSKIASSLLATIITTYWNPFAVGMSGYNKFMMDNYASLDASDKLTITSLMANGSLETLGTVEVTYATATGAVSIDYDPIPLGNGLSTDFVLGVVYHKPTNSFWFSDGSDTRGNSALAMNAIIGLTATDLIGYAFAFRGTGSEFVVSDSVADIAAA